MRVGELCAGYNGLGMAVEAVFGATPAWFSEYDAAPSKILAHHYPDVPNYGDMTKIDWAAIELADIISGGTPCQDLSAAGRRAGMTEGTRSNLWVQMREAVAVQRPRYVVWENVRGAYSAEASSDLEQCSGCMGDTGNGGTVLRALGRVLGDLSDLGYDTQWRGLRAADVGACHGRFRVFVLAAHQAISDTLRGGSRRWTAQPGTTRRHYALIGSGARGSWARAALANTSGTTIREHAGKPLAEEAWAGNRDRLADHRGERPATNWGPYQPAIKRWEAVMGRRSPAPTEPTGRDGNHRLSPRFTEWMMGLPDGWVTDPAIGISRNEQLKACGNGVVPQQAYAALSNMLEAFETNTASTEPLGA